MNTVELIRKKRDGEALTSGEIEYLVSSYTSGKIPDYQFSAFLMAGYFTGLNKSETAALTNAMLHSGKVVNLSSIRGQKIDKHSTGGVGDKTSLILAPIVASLGVNVPMISGRGLGHTGGTLDKLESIPGFRTNLSLKDFKTVLKKCGAVLIGQTKEIAPADKLIYGLRDVTATVESIPFITASIMSKKIAEGIDGLVLDVKTGNGAFMKKTKDALNLAQSLINTAKDFNKKVIAFITDMNQPLGNYIGNWLEVYESIQILKGEKTGDLLKLTLNLSGGMLYLAGKAKSIEEGIALSQEQIRNGEAFEKFREIVKIHKGSLRYIDEPDSYPKSKAKREVKALYSGYLSKVNTYEIGMAAVELGAGRKKTDDVIDHKAGIIFHHKIGDRINRGDIIATLFASSTSNIKTAEGKIKDAVVLADSKPKRNKLIKYIIE